MRPADLTHPIWREMDRASKIALCQEIAANMAIPGFKFSEITPHGYLDREEDLALFDYDGDQFVLVPANQARIGFDVNTFEPTAEQKENYEKVRDELHKPWNILEFVDNFTTAARTVTTKTMLVECYPKFHGRVPADPEDPEVKAIIARSTPGGGFTGMKYSGEFYEDGYAIWSNRKIRHSQVVEEIAAQGFRLPTSDEWEYLCGGGVTTLYRWGNDNPSDLYPTDSYKYMASRGFPNGPTKEEFRLHRKPNCFLLQIARDTYDAEIVAESGVIRGGDGGSSICGGMGFFLGWLPLATAYFNEEVNAEFAEESVHYWQSRHVIDV